MPSAPTQKKNSTKKPARRSDQAKNKGRQKPIAGMEDEFDVPPELQKAADAYQKALTTKNSASAKCTAAKETLIDAMKENSIGRVRVLLPGGVVKVVKHELKDAIKIEKPKTDEDD